MGSCCDKSKDDSGIPKANNKSQAKVDLPVVEVKDADQPRRQSIEDNTQLV
jgi:hypothetical protein